MKDIHLRNAFPPVDEGFEGSIECAFRAIRKEHEVKNVFSIRRAALLAVAMIVCMTAVGFATGMIQSVFSRMISDGFAGEPTADYEKLEQLAKRDASGQTLTFGDDITVQVALEQSYYNGEQLILGLSYQGPDAVEFFEKDDARYADVHSTEIVTVVDGHTSVLSEDIDIEQRFVPEVVNEIYNRVVEKQWAGFFWYDVWLGDGFYLPGIAGQETFLDGRVNNSEDTRLSPAIERSWNIVGAAQRYIEFETPLPEAARNQETLRVKCNVYMRPTWLCYEGPVGSVQSYIGYGEVEVREVFFEVQLSGEYDETVYLAEAEFPDHSASVTLKTTPIYAQVEVSNLVPEEWQQVWAEHEGYTVPPLNLAVDLAFDYEVLVEREGKLEKLGSVLEWTNGITELSGQFVVPGGTTAVILRPVYANSGVHSGEEVRISLE